METKANYVLIGAFTLAGFLGLLGFFLWFARVELDRQFAYYDISFTSVSGLSNASDVRFAGLPVGRVVFVGLSPAGDSTVTVRVEIEASTPVRTDSIATIESQGVTGVSFVGISPGTADAPLLKPEGTGRVPRIEAGRSVLQSLSEDAPELLAEALVIVKELSAVFSGPNRDRIERILSNVEEASEGFATAMTDFSDVAGSVSEFAGQIDSFNETLNVLTGSLTDALETAETTIAGIGDLAQETRAAVSVGVDTMTGAQSMISEAQRYLAQDLTAATAEVQGTVADLRARIDTLSTQADAMLAAMTDTGTSATARLEQAESLLTAADTAIARVESSLTAVETAAENFDTLMTVDGAALIAETRAVVADAAGAVDLVAQAAQTDLPAVVADIRSATATATQAINDISADLSTATGRIDGLASDAEVALATVTATFSNANATLAAIDAALITGDAALAAATRAFDGADRIINEDVAGITTDLRATLDTLNGAIGQVSADIPGITSDLRSAAATAEAAFAELGRVVAASGGSVTNFTTTALPDFTRLARETRTLIDNLDRLTSQIQRDPARFFLNQQTPDFRR